MTLHRGGTVRGRRGFALAVVIFVLFAVGMAALIGYDVVALEADMAIGRGHALEAVTAARSGLDRYVAEQVGTPDTVAYAVGNATVRITPRKVATLGPDADLYFLESEAEVDDPRRPGAPARRRAGVYARLHTRPVRSEAAALLSAEQVFVGFFSEINGRDFSPGGGVCAPPSDVAGVAARGMARFLGPPQLATIDGAPPSTVVPSHAAVHSLTGIRWDVLSDPTFPIPFDGTPPDFASLPTDSFPLVRAPGSLRAGRSWSGRGVLIVPGTLFLSNGFEWDGIVLAGAIGSTFNRDFRIRGTLIAGLDAPGEGRVSFLFGGEILYHSCFVAAANPALGYLQPLVNTFWEEP